MTLTGPSACFTYGSLMCPDIMARVCGVAALQGRPAQLDGYRRAAVAGEDYPGIVPSAAFGVAGVLYTGLPDSVWARLDRFEGGMYQREQVAVVRMPDIRVQAWSYVFKPEYRHLLLDREWDFRAFLNHGKARFEARYLGFSQIEDGT